MGRRLSFSGDVGVMLVLVGVALIFEILGWILVDQSFIFNRQRLFIIVLQMTIIGIMAVGVAQIIIMAGIDLSGGSIIGIAGLVAASLAQTSDYARAVYPSLTDLPVIVPVIAGILVGASLGLVNGGLVAYTKIPPFIATLGMLVAARGLARWYTSGAQVSFFVDDFGWFGSGATPIWIFLGVAVLFHVLAATYRLRTKDICDRLERGGSEDGRESTWPATRCLSICWQEGFMGSPRSSKPRERRPHSPGPGSPGSSTQYPPW